MSVRAYVPSTLSRLVALVNGDDLGPAPLAAHAVTAAVRVELEGAGEEDQEYAASSAAAQASVHLLADGDAPRRVVVAVDVPGVREVDDEDPTRGLLDEVVTLAQVAAVLVDGPDAEAVVAAARDALRAGAPDVQRRLERCLAHEPGWWATQEIGSLLEESSTGELGPPPAV